jgi:hypothetical protein
MTMDWQNRALVNIDMTSWYWDGATAVTTNLGTLGGTVRLGDGATPATFPTQVPPHGMAWGGDDYLRRLEVDSELTFTDPLPFSFDMLCLRYALGVGSFAALLGHPGGGGGASDPYTCFLYNNAGVMQIWWGTVSSGAATRGTGYVNLGTAFPVEMVTHIVGLYDGTTWRIAVNGLEFTTGVAAGCYAPDAAGQGLLIGSLANGAAAPGNFITMRCYNFGLYPFALTPSEIAQCYQQRLALLNRGT